MYWFQDIESARALARLYSDSPHPLCGDGVPGLAATASTWLPFRITGHLPPGSAGRALLGSDEPLTDLYPEVDPGRDHIRGPIDAPVTIAECGDFE